MKRQRGEGGRGRGTLDNLIRKTKEQNEKENQNLGGNKKGIIYIGWSNGICSSND